MIKILHTADLHLGKSFHEYSLIEDQAYMLNGLSALLADPSYDALVVSGDVFDRSIPSPEAVELFSGFLGTLKKSRPNLEILIIPGNHDSPARLAYGKELFAGLGVHIAGAAETAFDPVMIRAGADGAEICACFLLPFLYPGSLVPAAEGADSSEAGANGGAADGSAANDDAAAAADRGGARRGQAALAEEAARRLEDARKKALAKGASSSMLAAHLFCSGGKGSDSERSFLGQAEQVDPGLFAGFDYVALGHLHRPQKAGKNAWYSGSPLAYSFDEADHQKCFLSVEITGNPGHAGENPSTEDSRRLRVTTLPSLPLRPLRRLSGPFERFLKDQDTALKEAEQCFLEITLSGGTLTENALPILRQRFPHLLSLRQDEARAAMTADEPRRKTGNRNALDDFREFLEEIYGGADDGKLRCFAEILEDLEEA
ncbi:MAG: exonuclease SbcCD subunit D [Treponema sp.]|jgi:exonuclease SbcD|nr:exonuclease SbcCD subunit D [Treponema sp.]